MPFPGEREPLDWKGLMKARTAVVVVWCLLCAGLGTARAQDDGSAPARPRALTPLMTSFVVLQALDVASTYRSHGTAGRDANPLVEPVLGSPA
ncbi:MAG TPA: hypothetical protein VL309_01595, partial [Vicinamibacterales bacterium]|nr:hypothetical protein [Vicinamibacterales bacterium]